MAGWMEFRKDLSDDVPFSLASALELLDSADMLVGNMGSHVTRMLYNKMVVALAWWGACCKYVCMFARECYRRTMVCLEICLDIVSGV